MTQLLSMSQSSSHKLSIWSTRKLKSMKKKSVFLQLRRKLLLQFWQVLRRALGRIWLIIKLGLTVELFFRRGGLVNGKSVKFSIQYKDTKCNNAYASKVEFSIQSTSTLTLQMSISRLSWILYHSPKDL